MPSLINSPSWMLRLVCRVPSSTFTSTTSGSSSVYMQRKTPEKDELHHTGPHKTTAYESSSNPYGKQDGTVRRIWISTTAMDSNAQYEWMSERSVTNVAAELKGFIFCHVAELLFLPHFVVSTKSR